jgi:hypothetical protein
MLAGQRSGQRRTSGTGAVVHGGPTAATGGSPATFTAVGGGAPVTGGGAPAVGGGAPVASHPSLIN